MSLLSQFERYPLTYGPTPIEHLPRLSEALGGKVEIWAKRDDCNSGLAFGGNKLFGDRFVTPVAAWTYLPIAVAVLGYLMASRLPMPKSAMTRNKAVSFVLLAMMLTGYVCGFAMIYPELVFWMPTMWSIVFLIWGQTSAKARAMFPPPLFPRAEPATPLTRPQADLTDIVLDEGSGGSTPDPDQQG